MCPVFAGFTLAFALQLRKKHGKNLSQDSRRVPVGTMTPGQLTTTFQSAWIFVTSIVTTSNHKPLRLEVYTVWIACDMDVVCVMLRDKWLSNCNGVCDVEWYSVYRLRKEPANKPTQLVHSQFIPV